MTRPRTHAPRRGALRPALFSAALLGALGALPACSPVVRVRTEFRPPPGVALDPARFHLTLAHECDPHDLSKPRASPPALAPPPGRAPLPVVAYETTARGAGLDVQITVRGSRCWVRTTGWFDANDNGAVDRGDAVGSMSAAVLAEDRGPFRGNLVETAPVPLAVLAGPLAAAAEPPPGAAPPAPNAPPGAAPPAPNAPPGAAPPAPNAPPGVASPVPNAPPGAAPSAPNAPPGAADARKAGPPRLGCEGLFDPPEGAMKLCDEHVLADGAEIHWTSWVVTSSPMYNFQRYHERAADCDAGAVFKPPAPLIVKPALQVSRGDSRVSFHNVSATDYPTCATKPEAAGYGTVVVISTKHGR